MPSHSTHRISTLSAEQIQRDQRPQFSAAQRRRGEQARQCGAKKAEDESREKPLDHQPRMHRAGVKRVQSRKEQRPERHAGDAEQRGERKENPKWLGGTEAEERRTRQGHGPWVWRCETLAV